MAEESMSPKPEDLPDDDLPQVINLIDSQSEKVQAEMVRASRSYIGSLNADETDLHQGVALDVNAHNLSANTSWIGVSQSTSASVKNSLLVATRADQIQLEGSLAGGIYSESASLGEGSQAGILVTGKVSGQNIRTVVLVARQVEGPVETMIDTRQVALASVLTGIACGAILLLGQFLFRRKN
jgi:hypothetical protein